MTPPAFPQRLAIFLLLLGSLFIGAAHIAILPPWEGFDEPAHYSYIQQLAETGRWPRHGETMSRDIDAYLKVAPTAAAMSPVYSYQGFFAAPPDVIAAGRALIHTPVQRVWQPGQIANWQAQHPPLYYALLAPGYLISKSWSLAHQLFFLRSLSYLIAWLGLGVAALLLLGTRTGSGTTAAFALALWPAIFPMWFPEMARLGNDSLLVPLAAGAFFLMRRIASSPAGAGPYAGLGVILGLGLLTKATFLPLVAAIFAILLVQWFRARAEADRSRRQLAGIAVLAAVTVAISGWWYAAKYIETGSLIGSADVVRMSQQGGGLIEGLLNNANLYEMVRLPWLLTHTFLWGGTWSFVFPPRAALFALVAAAGLIAFGAFRVMRRGGPGPAGWLALATSALFIAALVRHALVLSSTGLLGGATWYLHAVAPVLAPLVGFGLAGLASMRLGRVALAVALVYPLLFLALATGIDALYFAGCGTTLPNLRYFDIASAASCAADLPAIYARLAAISLPAYFVPLFVAGWSLCVAGVLVCLRVLGLGEAQTSITSTR